MTPKKPSNSNAPSPIPKPSHLPKRRCTSAPTSKASSPKMNQQSIPADDTSLFNAIWDQALSPSVRRPADSSDPASAAADPALFLSTMDMFGTSAETFSSSPAIAATTPGSTAVPPDPLHATSQNIPQYMQDLGAPPLLTSSLQGVAQSLLFMPQDSPDDSFQSTTSTAPPPSSAITTATSAAQEALEDAAQKLKSRKLTSEEMDSINPPTTTDGKPRKHIRRACLECRKRHIRCDGVMPICKKCEENKRECSYVPSNRGGLRIPKVKQIRMQEQQQMRDSKEKQWSFASPCMMDTVLSKTMNSRAAPGNASQTVPAHEDHESLDANEDTSDKPVVLSPTAVKARQKSSPNTGHGQNRDSPSPTPSLSPRRPLVLSLSPEPESLPSQLSQISPSRGAACEEKINEVINGVFALSPYGSNSGGDSTTQCDNDSNSICNQIGSLNSTPTSKGGLTYHDSTPFSNSPLKDPSSVGSSNQFDSNFPTPLSSETNSLPEPPLEEMINLYYTLFHHKNPILPPRDQIKGYLSSIRTEDDSPNELILAMNLVVHIATLPSSPQLSELKPRIRAVYHAVEDAPDDVVKLQTVILLLLSAHLNTDNTISLALRNWLFYFLFHKLSSYNLMSPVSDFSNNGSGIVPLAIFTSPRLENTDKQLLRDSVARAIHESFFLEILFALIGRTPLTRFALSGVVETVPISNIPNFAYNSRYKTAKMVRTILCSMTTVGSGICFSTEFTRIQSLLSTFQGFLSSKSSNESQFPPLVDSSGSVNDGIHQAIMIINFASIMLHFPFSNLMQNKLPSFVDCTESSGPIMGPGMVKKSKHEAMESTNRCIEAANHIVSVIPTVGQSKIINRSPVYSCALSMAMLVHMKAYHWLTKGDGMKNAQYKNMDEQAYAREIKGYMDSVKIESDTLKRFSRNWILPGKLNTSLCNVMFNVLPELYEYTVETIIHPKRKATEELIERDCWMNKLQIPELEGVGMGAKPNMELGLEIFDQLFDFETTSAIANGSHAASEPNGVNGAMVSNGKARQTV